MFKLVVKKLLAKLTKRANFRIVSSEQVSQNIPANGNVRFEFNNPTNCRVLAIASVYYTNWSGSIMMYDSGVGDTTSYVMLHSANSTASNAVRVNVRWLVTD